MTESVSKWLDGDSANSFFEFKLAQWGDGNNDPMKGDPPWFDSLVCTLLNKLCSDAVANSFATFKISSCSTSSSQLLLLTFSCFILFSFSLLPSQGIELMATKSYHPSSLLCLSFSLSFPTSLTSPFLPPPPSSLLLHFLSRHRIDGYQKLPPLGRHYRHCRLSKHHLRHCSGRRQREPTVGFEVPGCLGER